MTLDPDLCRSPLESTTTYELREHVQVRNMSNHSCEVGTEDARTKKARVALGRRVRIILRPFQAYLSVAMRNITLDLCWYISDEE